MNRFTYSTLIIFLFVLLFCANGQSTEAEWRVQALKKYPELGVEGSALNRRFVEEYRNRHSAKPEFFSDPQWPLLLADELAAPSGKATFSNRIEFRSFFIFWAALGLAGFFLCWLLRSAALKRLLFPIYMAGMALIFGGFIWQITESYPPAGRAKERMIFVPALVLICVLNILQTRFCDACGRTLTRQPLFKRRSFCPYCGAEL